MSGIEGNYGLVMPFVVVKSAGGPFDDDAYVHGFELGYLQAKMTYERPTEIKRYVHTVNVPQLDLLAMSWGYVTATEAWAEHPDEWTCMTFTKPTDSANRED